jgi:hypothetical protein
MKTLITALVLTALTLSTLIVTSLSSGTPLLFKSKIADTKVVIAP